VTAAHHVVVSPALAVIGRTGVLAAARVTPPNTLRRAGELDLEHVDIAGMRALRGSDDERIVIIA
jgi:hypothetical protein